MLTEFHEKWIADGLILALSRINVFSPLLPSWYWGEAPLFKLLYRPKRATMRKGPPLPPLIFIGRAMTRAPFAGN